MTKTDHLEPSPPILNNSIKTEILQLVVTIKHILKKKSEQ